MIISFEGLPGCRKHEIYQALARSDLHIHTISAVDKEFHNRFVDDPVRWAFTYETSKMVDLADKINQGGSDERSLIVDGMYSLKHVYVNYLKHQEWLSDQEYEIFEKLYNRVLPEPKVIIYLFGSFDNNYKRMLENGLHHEICSEEEFKKLHYQFEWVFDTNNCQIPIYKVSVEDDISSIVNNIKEILEKIEILCT